MDLVESLDHRQLVGLDVQQRRDQTLVPVEGLVDGFLEKVGFAQVLAVVLLEPVQVLGQFLVLDQQPGVLLLLLVEGVPQFLTVRLKR